MQQILAAADSRVAMTLPQNTQNAISTTQNLRSNNYYRQGWVLVVRNGSQLPPYCLASGEPVLSSPAPRKLTYIPPWVLGVALVNPLIALILALFLGKSATLTYCLAPAAQRRRRLAIGIGLAMVALGFAFFVAATLGEPRFFGIGWLTIVLGSSIALVMGRPFMLNKIEDNWIYLQPKNAFWENVPLEFEGELPKVCVTSNPTRRSPMPDGLAR